MNTIKVAVLFLLLARAAFATITVTDRGTGNSNASSSSFTVQPATGPMLAGSTCILMIAMDNGNGATTNLNAATYTDSVGNLWRVRNDQVAGSANQTTESAILESTLTANFGVSDSLVINLTVAAVAKTWTLTEAAPSAGNQVVFSISSKGSASAATSAGIISAAVHPNDLVIAMVGAEWSDVFTGDSDTTNGSWSTAQHTGVGPASIAGMSIISQWKVVTAYATQSYDVTLSSAADCSYLYATFVETDPKVRTIVANGNTGTTSSVVFNYPLAAGSIGVLCLAADNAGASGSTTNLPTTPVDSKSNTWTLQKTIINDPTTALTGVEIGIYTSVLTTPLVVGDTMTITYPVTVPSKAWVVWEFAPTGAGAMTYVTGGTGTAANTASPTVTTGSIANGDYVVAMCGAEGAAGGNDFSGDVGTTNGTWKTQATIGGGSAGATSIHITTQYKKVTATATQTYNPTFSAAADTITGWIQVHDSSVAATGGRNAMPSLPNISSIPGG
jgi:hypothetical protein